MSVAHAHKAQHDCPHCEDLRYENEQLRIQLGQQTDTGIRHNIARAFNCTPKAAVVLKRLYKAYPRPVPRYDLERETLNPWEDDDRLLPANIISVYIVRLRRNLPKGAIATIHGIGYQLTEIGHAAVRAVVEGPPR